MLTLTKNFKEWLVENAEVDAEASDEDFRKAAATSLVDGTLTADEMIELTKSQEDEEAGEVVGAIKELTSMLKELKDSGIETEKGEGKDDRYCMKCGTKMSRNAKGGYKCKCGYSMPKASEADGEKSGGENDEGENTPSGNKSQTPSGNGTVGKAVGTMSMNGVEGDDGAYEQDGPNLKFVRVKKSVESYDRTRKSLSYPETTKKGMYHQLAGQQVKEFGRALEMPSQSDIALAGVWAKFQLASVTPRIAGSAQRAWEMLSDHERDLLGYLAEDEMWDDSKDEKLASRKGYRGGVKALIDDATSGGLEAAPIVFDDQVIQTPLLHGELFPLVSTKPLDRGRRVEGVATGTVTSSWGGVDDTAISLFDTTSYVSAFDTTIFRWEGAIKIGLDFMSDTPIDFGAYITAQYGERLLEDLDDVIAAGNGSTQPEGVINKTGTTTVAFGGTTSIGNYESLLFGVAPAELKGQFAASYVFCGTYTSYQRVRALPVGASDARRLFGTGTVGGTNGVLNRQVFDQQYKINESLTNAQIFSCVMARYRMYRRRGFYVRTSTEGDTLIRNNEMLIVAMARYGGQLERGAVAAKTTTAPA